MVELGLCGMRVTIPPGSYAREQAHLSNGDHKLSRQNSSLSLEAEY
jgi:hypothetical protein